jgi:1,4-dihydroxy-2-naphthoyl-CoA hydrolase
MGLFPKDLKVEDVNAMWLPRMDRDLGVVITEIGDQSMTAEFTVSERNVQPFGIMHGGMSCVVGESLGSVAGGLCLRDGNRTVVGQSLYAIHLRPARLGMTLKAVAEARHLGQRSQVWEILLSDKEQGKPIAKITLTLAVIEIKSEDRPKT